MAEFLTTRQLQEILHVDRTTIYRMADDGRIPAMKVGSQWRFPRRSIEDWLQTQSPVGTTVEDTSLASGSDLSKLLPAECVQRIQDTFADMLGVMMVVTDLHGDPVLQVSNPCGLFTLAEMSAATRQQCRLEWAALANQPSLQPVLTQGHLGLLHTRALVRVGSEIKAMLVAGGIAPMSWPLSDQQVARLAELLDTTEVVVRQKLAQTYLLTTAEQQQLLAYMQRIADIVAHIMTERLVLFNKLNHIAELSRI